MVECKGCAERREKLLALANSMAAWVRRPVGPPPIKIPTRPVQQPNDKPKTGKVNEKHD